MRPFPLLAALALLTPAAFAHALPPTALAQVPDDSPCHADLGLSVPDARVGATCLEGELLAFEIRAGPRGVTCWIDLFARTVYGCTTP